MEWDYEFDVVVVGSGNGALTAALCSHDGGAKTLVIEKSSQFGGTSATSGGGVWIPNNRYAKAENVDDSDQDARNYINSVSPEGMIKDELIETYISEGPRMINCLLCHRYYLESNQDSELDFDTLLENFHEDN